MVPDAIVMSDLCCNELTEVGGGFTYIASSC